MCVSGGWGGVQGCGAEERAQGCVSAPRTPHPTGGMQPGWWQGTPGHPIGRSPSEGKKGSIDTHVYTPRAFSGENEGAEDGLAGRDLVVKLSLAVPAGQAETLARCTMAAVWLLVWT